MENSDFKKLLEGALKVKNKRKIDDDMLDLDDDITCKNNQVHPSNTVKTRSCENCVCGRDKNKPKISKEELSKKTQKEIKDLAQSGCGNCTRGDAFRCSGCPFYGLPAFDEGDEVFFDS